MHKRHASTMCTDGVVHDPSANSPISPPIVQSVTFSLPMTDAGPSKDNSFIYSRISNPIFEEVEEIAAELEGAEGKENAVLFSSGMAAEVGALFSLLKPGDVVVAEEDMYGTTRELLEYMTSLMKLKMSYVDLTNEDELRALAGRTPALVWTETPTNPMMKVIDIQRVARITKPLGAKLIVDSTFAGPICQQPLSLGADVVVHSATKYLNGHSDVIAGLTIAQDKELASRIRTHRRIFGSILDPFGAWLLHRGMQTVALRMAQHGENALAVAKMLAKHPRVQKVLYPGLKNHPQHKIAARQMQGGYSGMVSILLKTDLAGTSRFLKALEVFRVATSLGGVESLMNHPATITHSWLTPELRAHLGITENMLRLSVGIETIEDLLADLKRALAAI